MEDVKDAVSKNGRLLREYIEFQNNKDVVLAAVANDGMALGYASPAMIKDEEVVLTAISQDPEALFRADHSLRDNKTFALKALSIDADLVFFSDKLKKDREVVFAAVNKNGNALQHAPDFQRDPQILYYAIAHRYDATPEQYAIAQDYLEKVELMVKMGVPEKETGKKPKKSQSIASMGSESTWGLLKHISDYAGVQLGDFKKRHTFKSKGGKRKRRTRRFYKR